MGNRRKKVIVITDGDEYARKVLDYIANELGGTSLSHLSANPTKASFEEIFTCIMRAESEPVFVLFDDAGIHGMGPGEKLLVELAAHQEVEIIGAIAVASHTRAYEWSRFDFAIDQNGELIPYGVDKEGVKEYELGRISGDTVYSLDQLNIPIIIAIGDIGKMRGKDDIKKGAPITKKAVELILERTIGND